MAAELEPWTPTTGSWQTDNTRWSWRCPSCGVVGVRDSCAVDMTCTGGLIDQHEMRVGIRPDAAISGPAALIRELGRVGTVQRVSLIQGALTLAGRAGAADALLQLADELDEKNLPFITPGALRDLATLHLAGER